MSEPTESSSQSRRSRTRRDAGFRLRKDGGLRRLKGDTVRFRLDNDAVATIDLRACSSHLDQADPDAESAFVIGIAKGGSTLLHGLTRALCEAAGRAYVDIPSALFEQGVEPIRARVDIDRTRRRGGLVFGGFRWLHPWLEDSWLYERRVILLTRDPRDALVSLYYSHAYSHAAPEAGMLADAFSRHREAALSTDVDAFAAGPAADRVYRNYARLMGLKSVPALALYRYEDVVFDKRAWAARLCADLSVSVSDDALAGIVAAQDIVPEAEDARAHVRQVAPGDARRKLSDETFARLSVRFAPILDAFGYD